MPFKNISKILLAFATLSGKPLFASEAVIVMGRRRSEVHIVLEILTIAMNGIKPTHLMYKANLSYSTLRKYLFATTEQGLVNKVYSLDGSFVYRTTEKGKLLLNKLEEVECVLHV